MEPLFFARRFTSNAHCWSWMTAQHDDGEVFHLRTLSNDGPMNSNYTQLQPTFIFNKTNHWPSNPSHLSQILKGWERVMNEKVRWGNQNETNCKFKELHWTQSFILVRLFHPIAAMSTWDGACGALVNVVLIEASELQNDSGSEKWTSSSSSTPILKANCQCPKCLWCSGTAAKRAKSSSRLSVRPISFIFFAFISFAPPSFPSFPFDVVWCVGFKEHLHPKFYEEFNFYADELDKPITFSVRVLYPTPSSSSSSSSSLSFALLSSFLLSLQSKKGIMGETKLALTKLEPTKRYTEWLPLSEGKGKLKVVFSAKPLDQLPSGYQSQNTYEAFSFSFSLVCGVNVLTYSASWRRFALSWTRTHTLTSVAISVPHTPMPIHHIPSADWMCRGFGLLYDKQSYPSR